MKTSAKTCTFFLSDKRKKLQCGSLAFGTKDSQRKRIEVGVSKQPAKDKRKKQIHGRTALTGLR